MSVRALLVAVALLLTPSCCHAGVPAGHRQPPVVARINLETDITDNSVAATIKAVDAAEAQGAQGLLIVIDTPGGSLDAGLRLVKRLEALKMPVACVVDGEAASEGFFILQGCQSRYMTSRSMLMAHEPFTVISSDDGLRMTRGFLQDQERFHDVMAASWSAFAARRLSISLKSFRSRIHDHNWWMDEAEARHIGAVDGVVTSSESAWTRFQQDLRVR